LTIAPAVLELFCLQIRRLNDIFLVFCIFRLSYCKIVTLFISSA
jgi:hypothetical protein